MATILEDPNPNGEYPDPSTISLSATAAEGFWVESTWYTVDGGAQELYITDFNVSGPGEHTVTYWSIDNTGVFELPKVLNFTIITNQIPDR